MNHVLSGLAANPALPSELVDRLIAVADTDLARDLADREDLSRGQAVALFSRDPECGVRLAYAGKLTAADVDPVAQPDTALALLDEGSGSPEWARLLAADPAVERREKLAACPGLPADVVDGLAADPDPGVVAELALWTTPETAARLAEHPHAGVRRAVAANESTPPDVLAALITGEGLPPARHCLVCDGEPTPFTHDPECPRPDCDLPPGASCDGSHESAVHEMRVAALRNPATPTEAVVGFADHPSTLLRWTLAAREDLPPQVCARLAADPVPGVRADLAENPATGEDVIRVLARDPDVPVRRGLARHPRVPLDVLTELARTAKVGATLLPRIATATSAEIEDLARSPDPAARMLAAQRRDLPPGTRDALARDPDAKVVKSVAPHPGLPEDLLRSMVDRHGARVLARVAANPGASPALLEFLTRQAPPPQKAFRAIARHPNASAEALLSCLADHEARPWAAVHPALPPRVIVDLLSDADVRVAEAAAANPSLPPAVMEDLVTGSDTPARTAG
ncbi:hypothetical protein ACH4S8_33585 [Streptomyces sp. NPDC021080]|uniref:hypothetical protein n=1 Tax=Streptomyces sp. NPDC021080 TaxID=3365110 RepID=UPI0037A2B759